jgi:hypothetical protein
LEKANAGMSREPLKLQMGVCNSRWQTIRKSTSAAQAKPILCRVWRNFLKGPHLIASR